MRRGSLIPVQVVWGGDLPIELEVATGATIEEVIHQSGILEKNREIDLAIDRVGIFGKIHPLKSPVSKNDRIEIYRPLVISSSEARRLRARVRDKKQ